MTRSLPNCGLEIRGSRCFEASGMDLREGSSQKRRIAGICPPEWSPLVTWLPLQGLEALLRQVVLNSQEEHHLLSSLRWLMQIKSGSLTFIINLYAWSISIAFFVNENHCDCLQCDSLSAGADFTHRKGICCLGQTIRSGSLGILWFLAVWCAGLPGTYQRVWGYGPWMCTEYSPAWTRLHLSEIKVYSVWGEKKKNLPGMQEMPEALVGSLSCKHPLGEEMATRSSILAWKIPRKEEPGELQSIGSQRVQHNWACTYTRYAESFWFSKPERETWVFAALTRSQVMLCCWPRDYTLRFITPGTWYSVYSLWSANHNRE